MSRHLITAAIAVASLAASGCANGPYGPGPGPRSGPAPHYSGGCYPGERPNDCRERLRYEERTNQRYVWRDGRYERQDMAGAAVAGAIIGFILGAAIVGSDNDRNYYEHHKDDRDWRARCAAAHPGFDPRTGTYLDRDGYRRYCTR